jgi:hypothetical protein
MAVRKVYEQLLREGSVNGWPVACRTVERLMRARVEIGRPFAMSTPAVAKQLIDTLRQAGVERIYGLATA